MKLSQVLNFERLLPCYIIYLKGHLRNLIILSNWSTNIYSINLNTSDSKYWGMGNRNVLFLCLIQLSGSAVAAEQGKTFHMKLIQIKLT